MRARRIPCSDELIEGGEGRLGDWLIENATARYVVRGPYSALGWLEEDGGTLIDAATPGAIDVLGEYLPDGDRSTIEAVNGEGEASLVLPGVTYRLTADDGALRIEGGTGRLRAAPGAVRTGATIQGDGGFFGLDGSPEGEGSVAEVSEVTRAAVTPEALWPDGTTLDEEVDADSVVGLVDGTARVRFPVVEGEVAGTFPPGSSLLGERDGCVYAGLEADACGAVLVRVADDEGTDLDAQLYDTAGDWRVPEGGGLVPVGPEPRPLTLWAGPAWEAATIDFRGKGAASVILPRAIDDGAVLAAFREPVSPDADVAEDAATVLHRLAGEGVGFAVLYADDEIPTIDVDDHDPVIAVAASRAGGQVWSWPWTTNAKRPAHGAVRWAGLGALDQLAVSEGGESAARRTVVDRSWVEAARAEADPVDWSPRPDGFWLDDLTDLDTYLGLLRDWVDVAPVGPRTWVELDQDRNLPAIERGFIDGRTTAGTGPRLILTSRGRARGGWLVEVEAQAPRWAHLQTLTFSTPDRQETFAIEGAVTMKWVAPAGSAWVVVSVTGDHARPDSAEPAWAVSAPLWP